MDRILYVGAEGGGLFNIKRKRGAPMKRAWVLAGLILVITFSMAVPAGIVQAKSPQTLVYDAASVLREMSKESDAETMADLLRQSEGVAIFPSVVKAGLIFGGRYGRGIVLRRDRANGGWFGPKFVSVAGASWGLQAGVQSTALVLVIMNKRGMDGFRGDKVTLSGDMAVAMGPVGRQAGAGTDGRFKASIYSYSMSKGLFAGLSLEGAVVSVDDDSNDAFWGRRLSPTQVLEMKSGKNEVQTLVREIQRLSARSH